MSEKIKTVLKIFGAVIGAILVFAGCFVGWLTVTEFTPDDVTTVKVGKTEKIKNKQRQMGILPLFYRHFVGKLCFKR